MQGAAVMIGGLTDSNSAFLIFPFLGGHYLWQSSERMLQLPASKKLGYWE
jgi:hypothetical protein